MGIDSLGMNCLGLQAATAVLEEKLKEEQQAQQAANAEKTRFAEHFIEERKARIAAEQRVCCL